MISVRIKAGGAIFFGGNFRRTHQKLLLVANQLQDFFYLILTAKTLSSVNLVSQLKLLPNLFEFKDDDTIVMSTIIKKLPET